MELYILDFSSANVFIYTLPKKIKQSEDVESYISNVLLYNLDEVQWMFGNNINLIDNRNNK